MTAQQASKLPDRYRLTVEDYLTLDRSGAFHGLRTELLEGDVIIMNPQFRPHGLVKMELYDRLRDGLRELPLGLRPMVEVSLELSGDSLPDPDILLTSEPAGGGAVPLRSVRLVVEVSDTSLQLDLGQKAALYARHFIPEYWVADVNGRVIHQMWAPEGGAYTERREVAFGEVVGAATIAGLKVETGGLG
jgi:Uma2 family endonuclease